MRRNGSNKHSNNEMTKPKEITSIDVGLGEGYVNESVAGSRWKSNEMTSIQHTRLEQCVP